MSDILIGSSGCETDRVDRETTRLGGQLGQPGLGMLQLWGTSGWGRGIIRVTVLTNSP
jgi:hypothetical protein